MTKIFYSEIPQDSEVSLSQSIFEKTEKFDPASALVGLNFYEFTLEELGLPSADVLLKQVFEVERQVGLQHWVNQTRTAKNYKGFSLTYNPNYCDNIESIYHQTWGSTQLTQNYSRNNQEDIKVKNTYYDTYAFRQIPPIVCTHLGDFLKKFQFPIFRSRVAYFDPFLPVTGKDESWHVDEPPFELLRINIPLQTSLEHLLDVDGVDEYGNTFNLKEKHLEVGKAYIWNTRIPHRVYIKNAVFSRKPRIHIVLGLSPWIDYNSTEDSFSQSSTYGMSIKHIVENKLFLK
jgi:hypothetical protein